MSDYIIEGLSNKLEELCKEKTDLDLPLLRQTLPLLTKDLDVKINMKALTRLTSLRPPFTPTKVISMLIMNEDFSALRRLHDFKGM